MIGGRQGTNLRDFVISFYDKKVRKSLVFCVINEGPISRLLPELLIISESMQGD